MFVSTFAVCILALLFRDGLCQGEPRPGDEFVEKFLEDIMQNYTTWLASEDPTPEMPAPVSLKGQNLSGVDVDIEITNHGKLQGYFDTTSDLFTAMSFINIETITVTRDLVGESISFGGNYKANGTLKINETLTIPFTSDGSWSLEANDTSESITFVSYKLDKDGFFNLSASDFAAQVYKANWKNARFTGTSFDYSGNIETEWAVRVNNVMADIYVKFLEDYENPISMQLPMKQLLKKYLEETMAKVKLSDIIGTDPTTTPTYPTTTTPPSLGSGLFSETRLVFLMIIFVLIKY